jgi:uncharacterized protein (DUF488 family)
MSPVWTVGHSTRSADELIALLRAHTIERLVDVRTIPRSRRHPHFNREAVAGCLEAAGIAYTHMPGLGGLRHPRPDSLNTAWADAAFRGYADYMQTPEFAEQLQTLIERAARERSAVMCAEAEPARCHRSLLSDALAARGVAVRHILTPDRAEPHALTASALVAGPRVTYPARQGRLA